MQALRDAILFAFGNVNAVRLVENHPVGGTVSKAALDLFFACHL